MFADAGAVAPELAAPKMSIPLSPSCAEAKGVEKRSSCPDGDADSGSGADLGVPNASNGEAVATGAPPNASKEGVSAGAGVEADAVPNASKKGVGAGDGVGPDAVPNASNGEAAEDESVDRGGAGVSSKLNGSPLFLFSGLKAMKSLAGFTGALVEPPPIDDDVEAVEDANWAPGGGAILNDATSCFAGAGG